MGGGKPRGKNSLSEENTILYVLGEKYKNVPQIPEYTYSHFKVFRENISRTTLRIANEMFCFFPLLSRARILIEDKKNYIVLLNHVSYFYYAVCGHIIRLFENYYIPVKNKKKT